MYVVIRTYSGEDAKEVFEVIEQRSEEIRELISEIPGFVSYTAFKSPDGGTALTVCEDKEGTDKSTSIAAAWVLENVHTTPPVPHIEEGVSVAHFYGS